MDNKENVQLEGTNEQKAQQLINLTKQGGISKELLDAILPHEKEFYKYFLDMFSKQLDAESKDYQVYSSTINNMMTALSSILPSENLDPETRKEIINLIIKLSEDYNNIMGKKIEESEKTKRTIGISFAATFILGVAAWLLFGGKDNNSNSKQLPNCI